MSTPPLRLLLALCAAATLTACSSNPSPYALRPHAHDFDPRAVPLPAHTPYDDNPTLRAVYQNYYWFGYADAAQYRSSSFCDNDHPWFDAQFRGYSDGLRAGARTLLPTTRPAR